MYVVIEGVDTTGKSTQVNMLQQKYKNCVITQEPSSSEFGRKIRELSLFGDVSNITQALLFMADRAEHSLSVLQKNQDKLIISDRSMISGIAYCVDLSEKLLIELNSAIALKPDLVVILTTNERILHTRLSLKKLDEIEKLGVDYLLSIQSRILRITKSMKLRHIILECDLSRDMIVKSISKEIDSML